MTWFSLWLKTVMVAAEAQQVMMLRMMRLGAGGAIAERETTRMISEKIAAAGAAGIDAAGAAMRGKGGGMIAGRTIGGYRRKVKANKRRLTRRSS